MKTTNTRPAWILACILPMFLQLGIHSHVVAQFTDNPALNTPVVTSTGEQAQPKIAANPNGGFYVSWFDNSSGGYDMYLQRMDSDGNRLWDVAGLQVADRTYSSTVDYGLDVDAAGNALLTFRDDRTGGDKITVTKVAPDGSFPWGSEGIQLSDGLNFVANPGVAAVSDGSVVVAWFEDGAVPVVSLSANGDLKWEKTITDPLGIALSDIKASDAPNAQGEVLLLMRTFGGFTTPGRLRAQKLDASGNSLWGDTPIPVMTAGSLQFGNFPDFITDQAGGMVIAWYQSIPTLQTYVQRIDASGSQLYQEGGLPLSQNSSQLRVDPGVTYDQETDQVYAFWVELSSTQSQNGIYAQRVDASGSRVWGNNGLTLVELGAEDLQQVRAGLLQGEPTVSYVNNSTPSLQTARLTADGSFAWSSEFVFLSGNGFSRLQKLNASELENILVWQAGTDSDIYAQNINYEGKLGLFDGPDTGVELSVSYNDAWNLVSLPMESSGALPGDIFPVSVPGSLFSYDGAYSQESSMSSSIGYWLNFSEATVTPFTGESLQQNERTLLSGWNIVGAASTPVQIFDTGNLVVPGTTYGFNGNYTATETLEPGYAYWVRTTGAGVVDLVPAGLAQQNVKKQHVSSKDLKEILGHSFDQFELKAESATGTFSQTFFFNGSLRDVPTGTFSNAPGEVPNPLRFTLPPRPPSGSFDSRLSGDRWLTEQSGGTIHLQNNSAPVTLTFTVKSALSSADSSVYRLTFLDGPKTLGSATVRNGDTTVIPQGAEQILFDQEITSEEMPAMIELLQNVPNPFNPSTQISFRLSEASYTVLDVYSLTGQHIKTLIQQPLQQGMHSVRFDASDMASGIYLYRLQASGHVVTKKMILIE